MRTTLIAPLAFLLTLSPPDSATSTQAGQPVAEIVTFRLLEGISDAEFLTAANKTQPLIDPSGVVIQRTLSKDKTDLWTDHILWPSLGIAKTVAKAAMNNPEVAPFMAMIDPDSVQLRHARALMQMD